MGIEDLSTFEILHGTFSLIFVVISVIIGIRILAKYNQNKQSVFITVGLFQIFLSSAWWGPAFSILSYLIFNYAFRPFLFLLLNNVFIPVALICWIYSYTKMTSTASKKRLFLIFALICIIYEAFLVLFLVIDPDIIGRMTEIFSSQNNYYALVFQVFAIVTLFVTGMMFSRKSLQSTDNKVKLKGRFLLLAFLSFTIGAVVEAIVPKISLVIVITRLLLISSAFEYYMGFFLPDRIANSLIKE